MISLFDWWGKWFKSPRPKEPTQSPPQQVENACLDTTLPVAADPVLETSEAEESSPQVESSYQVEPVFADEKTRRLAYFNHTKKRVRERYKLSLTMEVWEAWNAAISCEAPEALFVEKAQNSDGKVWRVWFDARVIFVVFDRGLVKTAVPNRGQFDRHVREALRERAARFAEKQPSSAPPKPAPICVQSMRLPPRHLRPRRDEAALARLKAKKTLEEEDY